MKINSKQLKKTKAGYLEGDLKALDQEAVALINTYRRRVSGAYIAVSGDEIAERFGADKLVRGDAAHAGRAGLSLQHKRGESETPD